MVHLQPELSFDQGTFRPLATSGACWALALGITAQDRVAVLGMGLVGNLVMQFALRYRPAQLIAVDSLELRCRVARETGAPEVVHAGEEDPVAAVRRLTGGAGASIVVDCVGGPPGVASFEQAQRMVSDGGLIQVNAKYHKQPLPLHVDRFQGKRGTRQLSREYRPRRTGRGRDGGAGGGRSSGRAAHHSTASRPRT